MQEQAGDSTAEAVVPSRGGLLDPERLADLLGAPRQRGLPSGRGVAYDSRRVRPGDVFFARPGSAGHGIEHAASALERGAAYIVSDRPHERGLLVADANEALVRLGAAARAQLQAPVVGVTGSAGKTTTKTLVTAALSARSTPGNLNTVPALVAALVEAALAEATLVQGAQANAGVNHGALVGSGGPQSPVVLELGIDRPGEMAELLAFCRPDHGLVTTIGESHLTALGSVASVAHEKSRLLAAASGVRLAGAGAAAHLTDDVAGRTVAVVVEEVLAGAASGPETTANSAPAGLAARVESLVVAQLRGDVLHYGEHAFVLPWQGRAMAENALLALVLAERLGVAAPQAFGRMAGALLEPGRLQRRELRELHLIDDSYNSNPLSAALALEVLLAAPAPRVAILGDMRELGPVSRQRHLELGAATIGLDLVIAVGEEASALAESNPAAHPVPDAAAAEALLVRIPPGATVLVKGSRSLGLERLVAALEAR